nr:hypothetical protein Iba_chr01bCG6250 [Ipomoea batatas]
MQFRCLSHIAVAEERPEGDAPACYYLRRMGGGPPPTSTATNCLRQTGRTEGRYCCCMENVEEESVLPTPLLAPENRERSSSLLCFAEERKQRSMVAARHCCTSKDGNEKARWGRRGRDHGGRLLRVEEEGNGGCRYRVWQMMLRQIGGSGRMSFRLPSGDDALVMEEWRRSGDGGGWRCFPPSAPAGTSSADLSYPLDMKQANLCLPFLWGPNSPLSWQPSAHDYPCGTTTSLVPGLVLMLQSMRTFPSGTTSEGLELSTSTLDSVELCTSLFDSNSDSQKIISSEVEYETFSELEILSASDTTVAAPLAWSHMQLSIKGSTSSNDLGNSNVFGGNSSDLASISFLLQSLPKIQLHKRLESLFEFIAGYSVSRILLPISALLMAWFFHTKSRV